MKIAAAMWHRWVWVIIAMVAVEGSGLIPAHAQQASPRSGICTPPERLLTDADREAIAKVVRNRIKERVGLTDQHAEQIQTILQSRRDEARADV